MKYILFVFISINLTYAQCNDPWLRLSSTYPERMVCLTDSTLYLEVTREKRFAFFWSSFKKREILISINNIDKNKIFRLKSFLARNKYFEDYDNKDFDYNKSGELPLLITVKNEIKDELIYLQYRSTLVSDTNRLCDAFLIDQIILLVENIIPNKYKDYYRFNAYNNYNLSDLYKYCNL